MKEKQMQTPLQIVTAFLLYTNSIVLSFLCISYVQTAYKLPVFILITVFFIALFIVHVISIALQKKVIHRALFSIITFIAILLFLWFILQKTGLMRIITDEKSLQEVLRKAGVCMPLLYILLQFLQVIILPIPGIVSTAVGVALFGAFQTTTYSLIGILLGSFAAFAIGRKLGNKAVARIIGEENLEKWQAKLKGKDNLILSICFLLPLFPDDILCFLAGLSSMAWRYFVVIISLSRILAITATCYLINFIPLNTWWGVSIWAGFLIVILVLFIIIYRNLDRIQAWYHKKRLRK